MKKFQIPENFNKFLVELVTSMYKEKFSCPKKFFLFQKKIFFHFVMAPKNLFFCEELKFKKNYDKSLEI